MNIVVKSEKRQGLGKNAARRLRAQGFIPAVLYGEALKSIPLVLKKKDIIRIMKLESRENTIFKLTYDSEKFDAMIKELQTDPTTDEIIHADLIRIAMDKPIGVKTEGGFVDFVTREVEVECLPRNIPESLEIEISDLHIHQSLKVENMTVPPGVRVITEPGTVLVLISLPHKEEEVFPGEKPEEAVVEEGKEPEVIKKERAPKEEEEEKKEEKKEKKEERKEKKENEKEK
jgi:large subunit ribosomal protein L25